MGKDDTLGARIRTFRKLRGLNQTQLAEKAGVSQGTISDYERGRFEAVDAESLLRIATTLHVDPVWLYFGQGMSSAAAADKEHEAELLGMYRDLDEYGQKMVRAVARTAVEQKPEPSPADPYKQAGRIVEGQLVPRLVHSPPAIYKRK